MKIIKYKLNCANPRLSDEEIDPLEQDDLDGVSGNQIEGWVPWDMDDLIDIQRIIEERMPKEQKLVIESFLLGMNFKDIQVSEKFWRYHYQKAIEFIQKELKL